MAEFEKVGECLFRYASNGVYYARAWVGGKQIWRSLRTTDHTLARRKLPDLRRELGRVKAGAGRCTLAELCDRYLATTRAKAAATIYRKEAIARRLNNHRQSRWL